MFQPTRDQARSLFVTAWRKYQAAQELSALEGLVVDVIQRHPEYQALLADRERALSREWLPEQGQINPFLHLSLHLALEEQLSIDQPAGISQLYRQWCGVLHDEHDARHQLLEGLGEWLWLTQRRGASPPDPEAYLKLLRERWERRAG